MKRAVSPFRIRRRRRRGYALLAVLWIVVGIVAMGTALSMAAHRSVRAAFNRRAYQRARWIAEGCVERARAVVDAALEEADRPTSRQRITPWVELDAQVNRNVAPDRECQISARPLGIAVDVNAADGETLRRVLGVARFAPARADSVADAILDWRDGDEEPRPLGAERTWYVANHRPTPRNGPFAAIGELRLVRGLEDSESRGLDTLLSAEPSRVALATAPLGLIAVLPGMTLETAMLLGERREREAVPEDLMTLGNALSRGARDSLAAYYLGLKRLYTSEPEAWLLMARGHAPESPVHVTIELELVHAGSRAAVVRRRLWWS